MSGDGRPDTDVDVDANADADAGTGSDAGETDQEMAPDPDTDFPMDPERATFLCEVADGIYGESSKSRWVSAILYHVNDLYDPDGDTSSEEIYLSIRHTMGIKAQGGINH